MTTDAIAVDEIRYNYGDIRAVDGISFRVKAGEIFGFLGPNGAGKSTTIKMLTGQLAPKQGRITVSGLDVARERKGIQARIGICFERTNLYEQMSGIENLNLFAALHGVKGFDVDALLKKVGLAGRGGDRVAGYSKGMKQRLMVGRALVSTPEILFLDEPTEGLDPASANNIRRVILDERARGATVFLTTHDMLEADKLSDRVAFINEGKIVALDTPDNLKQTYGKRAIRAQIKTGNGRLEDREIDLDHAETADEIHRLFKKKNIVTIHSEEASLEDIFIKITGRGLTG